MVVSLEVSGRSGGNETVRMPSLSYSWKLSDPVLYGCLAEMELKGCPVRLRFRGSLVVPQLLYLLEMKTGLKNGDFVTHEGA